MQEDILVELSDKDVEELADMYKSHEDELPYVYSFLQNCIKAKKNGMSDFVTVFSLRNCWKFDGTFIASMPFHGHDLVVHSLDPSGKNLVEGLTKTKRFKFLPDPARKFTLFYALHEQFIQKLQEVLTDVLKLEILFADTLNVYRLEKEKAIKYDLEQLQDLYVKEIEPIDIPIINSVWPFRYADSEKKHLDCLKLSKGFGVYLKRNNQLVSWVISSCLGQMTALQTLEGHKRKGYAALVVKYMSKYLAENGFDCCGTVYPGNLGSEVLLEKLQFKKIHKCQFIAVHNRC